MIILHRSCASVFLGVLSAFPSLLIQALRRSKTKGKGEVKSKERISAHDW
eukprot:m.104203 g.104203  ORF g.104203 m.104203 type:complete len:50 (+) comp51586_c0_seq6:1768-1917(+)